MSKGWTEERRKRQAEMIRKHRPWDKATGPRSQAGKAVSSQNALKHGLYGADQKIIKEVVKRNQAFLEAYAMLCGSAAFETLRERTDKNINKINGSPPVSPHNGETK